MSWGESFSSLTWYWSPGAALLFAHRPCGESSLCLHTALPRGLEEEGVCWPYSTLQSSGGCWSEKSQLAGQKMSSGGGGTFSSLVTSENNSLELQGAPGTAILRGINLCSARGLRSCCKLVAVFPVSLVRCGACCLETLCGRATAQRNEPFFGPHGVDQWGSTETKTKHQSAIDAGKHCSYVKNVTFSMKLKQLSFCPG